MIVLTRQQHIEYLCKMLCALQGFNPIDPTDGSPNWWMFSADATAFIDGLIERGAIKVAPEPKDEDPIS